MYTTLDRHCDPRGNRGWVYPAEVVRERCVGNVFYELFDVLFVGVLVFVEIIFARYVAVVAVVFFVVFSAALASRSW